MATTRPVAMAGLDTHPHDDGLFGPQSVSWRAYASPASAIGVATAVLLQMIHPRVVRMIDQASNVRNDPAGRAAGTSQYGITIIYGDTETAERAGEVLRTIHSHKRAVDLLPPTVQDLYGFRWPVLNHLLVRLGSAVIMKTAAGKVPYDNLIAELRAQTDVHAFGGAAKKLRRKRQST